jgi:hypothetical protein
MRHLWSLALSLVLTPLIYIAAGVSAVKFGDARGFGMSAGLGLLAAFVAGALFATLVMGRLSPVGPIVAGLVFLGVTFWAVLDRDGFESVIPADVAGQQGVLHVPVGMGTALLAAPLLLTVFSPRRWRSSAQPAAPSYDAAPVYPDVDTSAAPTYATSVPSAAPTYASPSFPATSPPSYVAPTYEPPVYTPPSSASTLTPTTYPAPDPASGAEPAGSDGERTGLM